MVVLAPKSSPTLEPLIESIIGSHPASPNVYTDADPTLPSELDAFGDPTMTVEPVASISKEAPNRSNNPVPNRGSP